MTVEQRIEALVLKWLETEHGIKAATARIDEDDWEIRTESSGGCDTCAWEEDVIYLTVWYSLEGESGRSRYVEVPKSPLTFLSELLRLENA